MNAHTKTGAEIAKQLSLPEIVAAYDAKVAAIPAQIKAFEAANNAIKDAGCVFGVYGDLSMTTPWVHADSLAKSLLTSAWRHVYNGMGIERLATPDEQRRWKDALSKPPPFTLENIGATFERYLLNPRGSILRSMAEVFCGLDDCFKSHDKMKIGVKGLPKRVVLTSVNDSSSSYGWTKVKAVINALASYQGKPLATHREIDELMKREDALLVDAELPPGRYDSAPITIIGRGIRLRRYGNGNGHLYFEPEALRDVNLALAEYYGNVLPDTPDENPQRPQSTAVSKDLQYYPTPRALIDSIIDGFAARLNGAMVLEPSCGDGRIMDALRDKGAVVFGVEVDAQRAAIARMKGHTVLVANFLETAPTETQDRVVMNPPFYGKHYAKHVRHAYAFLKPGGTLTAILPVTAREHGLLDDLIPKPRGKWDDGSAWRDLPVGAFAESGTNINTTILTLHKPGGDR